MVPGDPEERTYDDLSKKGTALPEGTIRNLSGVAERFGVKLPAGL